MLSLISDALEPMYMCVNLVIVGKGLVPVSTQAIISTTINLSPPSTAYMRQWIGAALVQIMASLSPIQRQATI